jgi:hypothetical protein
MAVKAHLFNPTYCPYCNGKIDAAANVNNTIPQGGVYGICVHCAQPVIYMLGGKLRKPNPGEVEAKCFANPKFADELSKMRQLVKQQQRVN